MQQIKEWETEPNFIAGDFFGIAVVVVRHPEMKHLCGYAGVNKGHPVYEVEYSDYDHPLVGEIDVHGGLSYSKMGVGYQKKYYLPDRWFFGFDCAHGGDYLPGMTVLLTKMHDDSPDLEPFNSDMFDNDVYRNIDYVQRETCKLAWQLAGNDVSDEAAFDKAMRGELHIEPEKPVLLPLGTPVPV